MIKKLLSFTAFIFIFSINMNFSKVYAYGGLMADAEGIKTVSTKWFDIIYAEECSQSALELSLCCDSIYEKLCKDYNVPANDKGQEGQPQFRIPLVITNGTDIFNAYFTTSNFNHIVLYDTMSEDNMAVFSNPLTGTFTHELTHAVSINMRNDYWRSIADIFSDNINIGSILIMPSLIKEGAAVEYESLNGEGRLNDGFYLHTVRQAKLSGKFPGYGDVTGARSKYPAGSSAYSFGGPFVEYLIATYGREAFNDFWYKAVNGKSLTFKWCFKKAYPLSLNEAWKNFMDSVQVPDVKADPLEEDNVRDFFTLTDKASLKNKRGSLYSSMTAFDGGFIYADDSGTGVYICFKKENGFTSPEKLFSCSNINSLRASIDGRFLLLSYISINHVNPKSRIKIYDLAKKDWISVRETQLKEACVLKKDGAYYLAAVKNSGQEEALCIYSLDTKNGELKIVSKTNLVRGQQIFSPVQLYDSSLAFIHKKGLSWSLVLCSDFTQNQPVFKTVALPQDVRIRSLNPDPYSNTLSFSYAKKDTFPRAGFALFDKDSCRFYFEKTDVSGGVYQPLVWNFNEEKSSIIYASYFYDNSALMIKDSLVLDQSKAALKDFTDIAEESLSASIEGALPYKKLYWSRGSFYILSNVQAMTFTDAGKKMNDDGVETSSLLLGLTFNKNNPWDSDSFAFGAGFDVFKLCGGLKLSFSGSSTTSLYEYSNASSLLFDAKGFTQLSNIFTFSSGLRLASSSSIIFTESNSTFAGRGEIYSKLDDASDEDYSVDSNNYLYTVNDASLSFSTIHKTGSGTYESAGFALGAGLKNVAITRLDGSDPDWIEGMRYNSLYPFAQFVLPKLLPFSCVNNFTYNLPVRFYASLLSARKTFAYLNAESVIFGYEIQRGYGTVPLYFNRFLFTGGYHAQFKNQNRDFEIMYLKDDFDMISDMYYEDGIYASIFIQPGLNTGALANSQASLKVGLQGEYHLHGDDKGEFTLSFTMSTLF
ncbi:hypothetical protein [Treponema sp.]|uniref:hypothetical protein n=1 Tax=Treponema sp. TaxID=166 RepID=UPI0025CD2B69|nr:hypothetical protein [Treponema sp.]MCR5218338.1 hypothetical protein [Treponema sp.]